MGAQSNYKFFRISVSCHLLIVILLISAHFHSQTACARTTQSVVTNWQYFISSEKHFRFAYPINWIQKPPRGNTNAIVKVSSNQADRANCYVSIKPSSKTNRIQKERVEHVAKDEIAAMRRRFPKTDVIQQSWLPTSPNSVLIHMRIHFENFGQTETIENIQRHVIHDGNQISMICGAISQALTQNEGKLRQQLFTIVESFKLDTVNELEPLLETIKE